MYDAALLDVFGRSDGSTHRLHSPELVCFEEAHTPEEIYAQRLRALLYRQADERRTLQEMVPLTRSGPRLITEKSMRECIPVKLERVRLARSIFCLPLVSHVAKDPA